MEEELGLPDVRMLKLTCGEVIVCHLLSETETGMEIEFPYRLVKQYYFTEEGIDMNAALVEWMRGTADTVLNIQKQHVMIDSAADSYLTEGWLNLMEERIERMEEEMDSSDDDVSDLVEDSKIISLFDRRNDKRT